VLDYEHFNFFDGLKVASELDLVSQNAPPIDRRYRAFRVRR
jgi:hypothetical protein